MPWSCARDCPPPSLYSTTTTTNERPQQQNQTQESNENDDRAANARRTPTIRVLKEESEEDRVKTRVTERSFFYYKPFIYIDSFFSPTTLTRINLKFYFLLFTIFHLQIEPPVLFPHFVGKLAKLV
jgi:hypothetical protein